MGRSEERGWRPQTRENSPTTGSSIPLYGALSGHQGFGPPQPKPLEHLGAGVGQNRPPGRGSAHLQCPGLVLSQTGRFSQKSSSSLEVLGSSTSTSGAEACELSLLLISEPGSWARWILVGPGAAVVETPDPGKRYSLLELPPSLLCQVL